MLNNALDAGITELTFWDMTPREIIRAIRSKNRVIRAELKEKAQLDYIQALLIAQGVAISLGDKSTMPTLEEAYPGVFGNNQQSEQEQIIQKQKTELSTLRFLQFARSYNERFKDKEVPK